MTPHCVALTLASLMSLTCLPVSQSCNKALCASDVSKCLIQVGVKVLLFTLRHTVHSQMLWR